MLPPLIPALSVRIYRLGTERRAKDGDCRIIPYPARGKPIESLLGCAAPRHPLAEFCRGFQSVAALCQYLQQRPEMAFVFAPSADRAGEQLLAHLSAARGQHRPLGLVETETGELPWEAEEFDQSPTFAFQIRW